MKTVEERGFIPGVWEEQIKVSDFIRLNSKKKMKENFIFEEQTLFLDKEYAVIEDEEGKFKFLVPYKKDNGWKIGETVPRAIDEDRFGKYVENAERKKMIETKILIPSGKEERYSFVQPDVGAVGLYGTRELIKQRKEYLKNMDNQFQTQEWLERRVKQNLEMEALIEFEEFALKQGVSTRKPAKNSNEMANYFWIATLYSVLEEPTSSFSFYNIFSLLDIYIESDKKKGRMNEGNAQRVVDELYCKLGALRKLSKVSNEFSYSLSIASSQINNTILRVIESAMRYDGNRIPFQLIFNEEEFTETLVEKFKLLFEKGHPIALSQSFRKRNNDELTLTSYHTFFINYEDVTFQLGSLDLEKVFLIGLNGGKDVESNVNFQPVKKGIKPEEITYELAMEQLDAYLRYFITLYAEYINAYAYFLDQNHMLPFRNALTVNFPHYLLNIPFHRVNPIITILTAIYRKDFEVKTNEKGFVVKVSPKNNEKEEFIGSEINKMIHDEIRKMLFYKNGKYNIVFFSEAPFFEKEDRFELNTLSPESFSKTSFSGFHKIEANEFVQFIKDFHGTSYTHIRLNRK